MSTCGNQFVFNMYEKEILSKTKSSGVNQVGNKHVDVQHGKNNNQQLKDLHLFLQPQNHIVDSDIEKKRKTKSKKHVEKINHVFQRQHVESVNHVLSGHQSSSPYVTPFFPPPTTSKTWTTSINFWGKSEAAEISTTSATLSSSSDSAASNSSSLEEDKVEEEKYTCYELISEYTQMLKNVKHYLDGITLFVTGGQVFNILSHFFSKKRK